MPESTSSNTPSSVNKTEDIFEDTDTVPTTSSPALPSQSFSSPSSSPSVQESMGEVPSTGRSHRRLIRGIGIGILVLVVLGIGAGTIVLMMRRVETEKETTVPVENVAPAENLNQPAVNVNSSTNTGGGSIPETNTPVGDTDGDGLSDIEEGTLGTNPKLSDTDGDRLFDLEEVRVYKTDPLKTDTDGDTYSDGMEVQNGYDPRGPGKLRNLQEEINKLSNRSNG